MLSAIIIGLIVGIVARFLMPGKNPMGIIWTILLGIGGSLIGTWIGRALGFYGTNDAAGFLMSVLGAVLLLLLFGRVTRGRRQY